MDKKKPGRQISFRVTAEQFEQIEAWSEFEDLAVADFCRKILKYGLRDYEAAGSLHVLRLKESQSEPDQREKKRKAG